MPRYPHNQSGITLIELLIALAILMILTAASVPAFSGMRNAQKINNSVNTLFHSIHLARQISRTNGTEVILCGGNKKQCNTDNNWQQQWIVFENLDADSPPQVDPGETLHLIHKPDRHIQIISNRPAYALRPFGKRATNGTLTLCSPDASTAARAVVISYTGKPRVTSVTNNNVCEQNNAPPG